MTTMDALFRNQGEAIDPVCKMTVDKAAPPGGTAEHAGATYYFCSTGCQHSFVEDPEKYV